MNVNLATAFDAIAETDPLVNAITNAVTVNDVANATLFWGGLPVMSDDENDVVDMVAGADGLLLNMGTTDETGVATMLAAGRSAIEHDVPIVLDPVGVGATPARDETARRLTSELDVAVINGNYGEITALAGQTADVRGVESVGDYSDIARDATAVAADTGAVVVASGPTDVVATADRAFEIETGHELMGQFVGTGCMQGVTQAVFAAAVDTALDAVLAGTLAYGRAGERAAAGAYGEFDGPASYRTSFLDAIAGLDAAEAAPDEPRVTELR
ncbi:hydroxyethylthiazole kinase [Halobacteriales archaeon SW_8_65_20]|nr:MAG: hydroxyethylthiazole kinase [Halobacteriales archaeon SW_8_65_20]